MSSHPEFDPAARLRAALADLLDGRDYDRIRLDDVLALAGVDRATFTASYRNLDECFTAVWTAVEEQFLVDAVTPFATAGNWLEGMRAAAWSTCRFMQEDHGRARIFLFKLEVAGEQVRAQRDQLVQVYADAIHRGRFEMNDPDAVPRDLAVGIAVSIWDRINLRVRSNEFLQMASDVPDLLYLAVLPYLGPDGALAELERGRGDLKRYEAP